MERKYLIAVVLLSVGLLAGIILLVRQNGGFGAARASLADNFGGQGSDWVQIQPRVKADTNGSDPDLEAKSGNATAVPIAKTKTAAKTKPAPVKWCDPALAAAVTPIHSVVFNEIAWMGTAANYNDEWIELKNITAANADLSGWQVQNKSQKLKISFNGGDAIAANGLYLLERTDDGTVPGISANKIYTGSLANSNEILYLFDAGCNLQDMVAASPKWPAGNNDTKQTMVRLPGLEWADSAAPAGTPGK